LNSEKEFTTAFLNFLKTEKGYPEESLVTELRLSKNMWADIVVIDPENKDILAIFELKRKLVPERIGIAVSQIERCKEHLGVDSIRSFVVTTDEHDRLVIYQVNENGPEIVPNELFLSYKAISNSSTASKKNRISHQTETTVDRFKLSCYLISFLAFVLFILDVLGVHKFTAQQLSLFGIVVAFIAIPYAAKLKVLGFEFERHVIKNKT